MQIDPPSVIAAVTGAIHKAAQATGASFQYLLATAKVESNLNPNAAVSTTSAKGLYQFIGQTWLATLKEHGPAHGYGPLADAITRQPSGEYTVNDQRLYQQIMNLRSDPQANALMAGVFTKDNTAKLASTIGRNPTDGELYIAHFLGAGGAAQLINLTQTQPNTRAADVFPRPASANRSIFYDRSGNARSVSDVYRVLVGRYDVARAAPSAAAVPQATTFRHRPRGSLRPTPHN